MYECEELLDGTIVKQLQVQICDTACSDVSKSYRNYRTIIITIAFLNLNFDCLRAGNTARTKIQQPVVARVIKWHAYQKMEKSMASMRRGNQTLVPHQLVLCVIIP